LTISAKKILTDVLDSFEEREATIKLYSERAETKAKNVIAEAECDINAKRAQMDEDIKNWEGEKEKVAKTYHFENNKIMLDIGGQRSTTTLTTLTRFPNTMIGAMFSGRHDLKKDEAGAYFIDRDGRHFHHILNFLRSPEDFILNLEPNLKEELKREANFYGLSDLMFPVAQFCPAQPIEILSVQGNKLRISQNAQGMWLMATKGARVLRDGFHAPIDVNYCQSHDQKNHDGWINDPNNRPQSIDGFNIGRQIFPCQPESSCPRCFIRMKLNHDVN
jgi:hypothetical protein